MDTQEKINDLMGQEEFVDAFKQIASPEEIVNLFAKNGVEVPLDVAQEVFEMHNEEGELSEEALEEVSGGGWIKWALKKYYYAAGYIGARIAGWDKKKSKAYASKCEKIGSIFGTAAELAI